MNQENFTASKGNLDRAVIIGGGIAGLMAAKMLAEFYKEVVIVDKDDFPEQAKNRLGVPQSFQPHRLTPRGRMIMERLFPGLNDELLASGAPSSLNKIAHFSYSFGSISMPIPEKDATFSRALLEWVIRKRVKKMKNVKFLTKHEVIGLKTNFQKTSVTGVLIRNLRESRQQKMITANLILDASGSSSKLVTWLEELGYTTHIPDKLKASLGYSTRHYQVHEQITEKWDVIRVDGNPTNKEFTGVFSIVENNTAEMLLWGVGGQFPPTNPEEFEKSIPQLSDPLIAGIIEGLEPITSPRGYRISELYRHHFEQMKDWPSGLLVIGDALCNFDPIYGLGMTMAAIEVEQLELYLKEQLRNPQPHFEQRVLQGLQDVLEPAWWLMCVYDLQWSGVEYHGQPLEGIDFAQEYLDLLLKQTVSSNDVESFLLYWGVNSLLFSPHILFNDHLASSVLAASSKMDYEKISALLQEKSLSLKEQLKQIPSFSKASFIPFPPEQ